MKMVDIVLDECRHGIPLINGKGCMICSNRTVGNKVCVNMNRERRESTVLRKLCTLAADVVQEIPASMYA